MRHLGCRDRTSILRTLRARAPRPSVAVGLFRDARWAGRQAEAVEGAGPDRPRPFFGPERGKISSGRVSWVLVWLRCFDAFALVASGRDRGEGIPASSCAIGPAEVKEERAFLENAR